MASGGRVWTVMPAAGRGSRFGGTLPKPLLRVRAPDGVVAPMLLHVLARLPRENVAVGLSRGYVVPGGGARVIKVRESCGPADTLLQMLRALPCAESDAILTADCDTVVLDRGIVAAMLDKIAVGYEACVAVTRSDDPNRSYVNEYPFPDGFAEKRRISQYAMVSLRAFAHAGRLQTALERAVRDQNHEGREPHLSHALCGLPGRKRAVQVQEWWDWGTPERLVASGAVLA